MGLNYSFLSSFSAQTKIGNFIIIIISKYFEHVSIRTELDNLRRFSQCRSPTPHFFLGGGPAGRSYDPQSRSGPKFMYSAPTPQVSLSYVYSFRSYRVNTQTNKQTDAAENIKFSSLRYDVGMGVDPWVDRGTCPPTFWSGKDALCFVPYVFGVDNFCINAHSIHWIGAIFSWKLLKLLPPDVRFSD